MISKSDEDLAFPMEAGVSGTGHWLHLMMELSSQFDQKQTQPISFVALRLVPDREDVVGNRYTFAIPLYISAEDVY